MSPGPGETQPTEEAGRNDVIIIVVAAVGGSVVLIGVCVCAIAVWCCLIKCNRLKIPFKNRMKIHFRSHTLQRRNYKGNTPFVLPYTIYGE